MQNKLDNKKSCYEKIDNEGLKNIMINGDHHLIYYLPKDCDDYQCLSETGMPLNLKGVVFYRKVETTTTQSQ